MNDKSRPKPIKAISLREKRRIREDRELEFYYGWWIIEGRERPRTLMGDEVEYP